MEAPLEIRAWTLFYSLVKAFQSLWEGVVTIVHAFFCVIFYHTFQPVAAPGNRNNPQAGVGRELLSGWLKDQFDFPERSG